jgi:Cysteine-rich CWC
MSIACLKNPDPRCCPLCGNINACAVAGGQESCWCFTEPVPPEILKRIPGEARGIACVCRRCISSQRALARALEEMSDLLKRR